MAVVIRNYFQMFTIHLATITWFKNSILLKFITALHVLAYSLIIRYIEIEGNCCAFHVTVTSVFKWRQCSSSYAICNVFFGMPIAYEMCSVMFFKNTWWWSNRLKHIVQWRILKGLSFKSWYCCMVDDKQ
jgi:hypothetical protein